MPLWADCSLPAWECPGGLGGRVQCSLHPRVVSSLHTYVLIIPQHSASILPVDRLHMINLLYSHKDLFSSSGTLNRCGPHGTESLRGLAKVRHLGRGRPVPKSQPCSGLSCPPQWEQSLRSTVGPAQVGAGREGTGSAESKSWALSLCWL